MKFNLGQRNHDLRWHGGCISPPDLHLKYNDRDAPRPSTKDQSILCRYPSQIGGQRCLQQHSPSKHVGLLQIIHHHWRQITLTTSHHSSVSLLSFRQRLQIYTSSSLAMKGLTLIPASSNVSCFASQSATWKYTHLIRAFRVPLHLHSSSMDRIRQEGPLGP
jgi:hypothetical protein